jgi:hypothetical protein
LENRMAAPVAEGATVAGATGRPVAAELVAAGAARSPTGAETAVISPVAGAAAGAVASVDGGKAAPGKVCIGGGGSVGGPSEGAPVPEDGQGILIPAPTLT